METEEVPAGGIPAFVKDPRGLLRRRWLPMLLVLLVGGGGTFAYVATIPVTYLATSTILASGQQISQRLVTSTVDQSPFDRINALIGEILSRERLTSIIEKHNLYPELRDELPLVQLVAEVRANTEIGSQRGVGPKQRNPTSTIYAISFRHDDPNVAAAVSNDIASLFTAASSRIRGQQARLTTQFVQAELDRTERELREADGKISDFKKQYRGELPNELPANLQKLEMLAKQREMYSDQLQAAQNQLTTVASTGDLQSPSSPYARLSAMRSRLALETSVHTDEHPNVISLRRQIDALASEIEAGGHVGADPRHGMLLSSAERQIAELREELAEVEVEIVEVEGRIARTPEHEETLSAMTEQVSVMRETYLSNLRKVEQAELAENLESAQQGERVQVLDRALPPGEPEAVREKYLVAGLLATLLAALGLGVGLELLDPVLLSAEQLEERFGVTVLGSVPRIA